MRRLLTSDALFLHFIRDYASHSRSTLSSCSLRSSKFSSSSLLRVKYIYRVFEHRRIGLARVASERIARQSTKSFERSYENMSMDVSFRLDLDLRSCIWNISSIPPRGFARLKTNTNRRASSFRSAGSKRNSTDYSQTARCNDRISVSSQCSGRKCRLHAECVIGSFISDAMARDGSQRRSREHSLDKLRVRTSGD